MSYHKGLGQLPPKPGGTTGTSTTSTDRTVADWTAGLRAGGDIASGIITAFRGPTTPATTPVVDETVYYTPTTTPTESSWTLPIVVGGIALLGIGAFVMLRKKPVSANRRRRVKRNYSYEHISHPYKYGAGGRPVRNRRRSRR